MKFTIEIPGKPVGKERPRFNRNTGAVYTPKRTREYEGRVAESAMLFDVTLMRDVQLLVYWGVGATKAGPPPKRIPDVDNVLKSIMDGLEGVAYESDSEVYEARIQRHATKYGGDSITILIEGHAIRDD